MADDVFADDKSAVSVLDTLVGEGKKFGDAEALAKGKLAADAHISKIEQENAELKAKAEAATSSDDKAEIVKELLEKLKTSQPAQGASDGEKTMSTEELQETIRSVLQDDNDANTKASNRAKGNALVLEKVGGNVEAARQLVAERAAAVGLTPAKLAELSEDSPTAFAALIDPTGSTASSGSPSILPHVNTNALGNDTPALEKDGFKTKAWFDAKKKEVGHVKYLNDQSIQNELTRSMNGLGALFNN